MPVLPKHSTNFKTKNRTDACCPVPLFTKLAEADLVYKSLCLLFVCLFVCPVKRPIF